MTWNTKKTYWQTLWLSMVGNRMILQKLQHLVTWFADISTDFYYEKLLEIGLKIGTKLVYYLAPSLINKYVNDISK